VLARETPHAGEAEMPIAAAHERLDRRGPVLLPEPAARLEALGVDTFELLEVILDKLVERARAGNARPEGQRPRTVPASRPVSTDRARRRAIGLSRAAARKRRWPFASLIAKAVTDDLRYVCHSNFKIITHPNTLTQWARKKSFGKADNSVHYLVISHGLQRRCLSYQSAKNFIS